MLKRDELRRRTKIATQRLVDEKFYEDKKQYSSVEPSPELELEESLEFQIERKLQEGQARRQREVSRKASALFRRAVCAADAGKKETFLEVSYDLLNAMEEQIRIDGFIYKKSLAEDRSNRSSERWRKFASLLEGSDDNQSLKRLITRHLDSAEALHKKPDFDFLSSEASCWNSSFAHIRAGKFFAEKLKPRNSLYRIQIKWEPLETDKHLLKLRGHVPSWILSEGGRWTMGRIADFIAEDADKGEQSSRLRLSSPSNTQPRWGHNRMIKFMHCERPVGVTPFDSEIMVQTLRALGLSAELLSTIDGEEIKISW